MLGRDASERSIMFRVGRYLAPEVEERWPGELWVDLEYNRMGEGKIAKTLVGLPDTGSDSAMERAAAQKRSVLPDLIIHDRAGTTMAHNILVVEAKKHPASQKAVGFDLKKLRAYKQQLEYQYAVYVEFGEGRPRWQWIDIHHELVTIRACSESRHER